MNPRAEDFERLAIRWTDAPHMSDSFSGMIAAVASFPQRYAKNRDTLPQNDADRAFGLVARACFILDRSVAMAQTEDEVVELTNEASGIIDEALKLDPTCYDALRIRQYLNRPTRDDMVLFLEDAADDVREACLKISSEAGIESIEGHWSLSVYLRPYLRWLFDLANEQLSCGRYTRSLEICLRLLDLDETDVVGARHIAALDYVKLEDQEGLATLIGRYPNDENAWFLLARCFIAYKQRRLDDAAAILHRIVHTFAHAGCTLTYQDELPAGMFSHLEFAEGSADELYVAVSEAAVVLDENCGDYLSPLSDWIIRDPVVEQAYIAEDMQEQDLSEADGPSSAATVEETQPDPAQENDMDGLGFADITSVDDLLSALGPARDLSRASTRRPYHTGDTDDGMPPEGSDSETDEDDGTALEEES